MKWILDKLANHGSREAFVTEHRAVSYADLCGSIRLWRDRLSEQGIEQGNVVAVIGDYSPEAASLLMALLINGNIVVPLTLETRHQHGRFMELAGVEFAYRFGDDNCTYEIDCIERHGHHPHIAQLRENCESGLVLFTSGTSGESKAAVLSVNRLLNKFSKGAAKPEKSLRSLVFLKMDHIGGINTLCSILFSGGTVISVEDRSAASVCRAIQTHRVELLPTTPTFLNMLLLSGMHLQYDLSTLKVITYGTEPMPRSTLTAVNRAFPDVKLKQTYGLTELGIMATRSKDSNSDWVMIGGEGVETKVVNNILYIRARSAMLGYLNAQSPFTADGWYITGDRVEVDGEYFRILGRESEIINVGGEKVYPAEVESALLEMDNVRDVLVQGRPNPVTGQIVSALFVLDRPEERTSLQTRVHAHCKGKLEPFKIPKLIKISDRELIGDRLKKSRNLQMEA